jgi:hypothetical protein
MRFLKLVAERALGPGHVRVQFTEAGQITEGELRCVVQRVGRRDSFLGENGWDDAAKFFMVNIESVSEAGESSFLLKPVVVQHMEASSNYELKILDANENVLGACNFFWKGVPGYRPSKDAPQPIIGSEVDPSVDKSKGAPIEPDSDPQVGAGWGSDPIIEGESSGSDGILDHAYPQTETATENHQDEGDTDVAPRPPKILMNCPLDPTHQIFSDMRFCPLCSRALKRK